MPGLLALGMVLLLAACGNSTAALPPGLATPGPNGHYRVGEPASIGTYVITVDKVLFPPSLQGINPAQGMKFMVVDVTIKTIDTQNDRISAAAQLVVKDSAGKEYALDADVTPTTDLTTTQLPDTIPALGSIHGEIAYQVPADARDLRLVFNPSFVASLIGHGRELTIDLQ